MKTLSIADLNKLLSSESPNECSDKEIEYVTRCNNISLSLLNKKQPNLSIAKYGKKQPKISSSMIGNTNGAGNRGMKKPSLQRPRSIESRIAQIAAQTGKKQPGITAAKKKPCTVDNNIFYSSLQALVTNLGSGKAGYKHPNFRYLSKDEIEKVNFKE